ncbi:ead/Ea22-like family protein [Salmonella enterica]|nr:ead/Ea22-like family protein [Salmonella enterica subsp. enterica serovar Weltevreden]EEE1294309.1 ead/Ea22-like family protein [Salmonella enterica subsp. diarizonae]EIS0960446.1 ead/Ea22-like family protein [Salmonella enterica]
MSNIDKQALREELSNPAIGSKDHLRKLALSLLDELDVKEEQRANWFQMAQKLGEDLDAAERHIAETNRLNAELTARIETMDRRIAELEARTVTLPDRKSEIFWPGDAYEFDSLGYVIAVKSAIHAAGIQIIEEGKTDGQ